jgi:3-oxoacyl-[acyl-carrier protein] reductase
MSERKAAIITGSATGVGAATALMLARRGWNVVINYSKSVREADEAAAACRDAGADVLLQQGDVADDAACRALVAGAVARWHRLDALVNNAGITTFVGAANWEALDVATFEKIIGVNVVGTFQMIRAAAPHLTAAKGAIVNVSSVAGALGVGSSVPYVASKGAVNSMTLHLARAMAPDVRVNAVCPGLITTRWFVDGVGQEAYEKLKAGYERSTPLATPCSAEDVAEAVVWLIEGARTVTGELILLDSGMHLGMPRPTT